MKNRVVYIYPVKASFVLQDIKELSNKVDLISYYFDIKNKWLVPFQMLRLCVFLLFKRFDSLIINFGGYHAFIGTRIADWKQKKSFVILNGIDAVSIPEWEYGYLRGGLIKLLTLKAYKRATKLLPVSESLMQTENSFAFDPPKKLGLSQQLSPNEFDYQVIPNGFDSNFWVSNREIQQKGRFITVIGSKKRADLKGLDLIRAVAKFLPDNEFVIAGLSGESFEDQDNVKYLGFLSLDQLREEYQKSRYYLQLSSWEGFGCALCEAMLCGCIPIVSSVNTLPEIVGESKVILKDRNVNSFIRVIGEIESTQFNETYFIDRVQFKYSISSRVDELLKVTDGD